MIRTLIVIGSIIASSALTARAQTADNPLASITRLSCRFTVYAEVSWRTGEPKVVLRASEGQEFLLNFEEIDTDGGTALLTATAGQTLVTSLLTSSSLHFLERAVTGTVKITSVFAGDGKTRKYRAVHARHDYVPMSLPGFVSEPSVSQYYGFCEVPASVPSK